MLLGVVNCNGTSVYSKDTLYAIGFRNPTGNIHGRVTYANGQAVQNAFVRVQNKDAGLLGQSVHLTGDTSSYMKLDSLYIPYTDTAETMTVETWIRPDDATPKNQVIFSRGGQYEWALMAAGSCILILMELWCRVHIPILTVRLYILRVFIVKTHCSSCLMIV